MYALLLLGNKEEAANKNSCKEGNIGEYRWQAQHFPAQRRESRGFLSSFLFLLFGFPFK
jgi:hypothetical protein